MINIDKISLINTWSIFATTIEKESVQCKYEQATLASDIVALTSSPFLLLYSILAGSVHGAAASFEEVPCAFAIPALTDTPPLPPNAWFLCPDDDHIGMCDRRLRYVTTLGGPRPEDTLPSAYLLYAAFLVLSRSGLWEGTELVFGDVTHLPQLEVRSDGFLTTSNRVFFCCCFLRRLRGTFSLSRRCSGVHSRFVLLFVASQAEQGSCLPALTHIMASSSASVPVLAPVAERLATAMAKVTSLEREVMGLEQEKGRLGSRASAEGPVDNDHATAMADCQSRLDAARQRRQHAEAMALVFAKEQCALEEANTVAQRREVPPQPAALQSAPVSHALYRVLRSQVKAVIPSPSKSATALLVVPFAHFIAETPLTVKTDLLPPHYASFGKRPDAYSAGLEAAYTQEALKFLPVGVHEVGKDGSSGKINAKRLFSAGSKRGYPGFSGELKSLSPVAWNEALTYVTMSMLDSLFPSTEVHDVYHVRPPTGYALLGMGGSGFFSAVEWVARLFIGPISFSFTLGSEQHKAAVNKLDFDEVDRWVTLDVDQSIGLSMYPEAEGENAAQIMWSTTPAQLQVKSDVGGVELLANRFIKIITHKAFSHLSDHNAAYQFRHLHRVYAMYADLFVGVSADGKNDRPPALVSARLLYGAFSVLVDMPFIVGRPATEEELDQDGPVLKQLAAAIAWLAHRGLLYCDLRVSNVVVADKQDSIVAHLIDYDDMVIVAPGTIQNTDAFVEKVGEHAWKYGLGNSAATIGDRDVLRGLLDEALQEYEVES